MLSKHHRRSTIERLICHPKENNDPKLRWSAVNSHQNQTATPRWCVQRMQRERKHALTSAVRVVVSVGRIEKNG